MTNSTRPPRRFILDHRPVLDGFRGLAIIIVMLHHIMLGNRNLLVGGNLGVDVFFVLSGFLITTILVEEWQITGSIRLGAFYLRRLLRLYPALLTVLVGVAVIAELAASSGNQHYALVSRRAIPFALVYLSNWAVAFRYVPDLGPLYHTWSLAVEEQFYLLWAPVLWLVMRLRLRLWQILGLLGIGMLGSVIISAVLWQRTHFDDRVYTGLDTRADSLLAGCAVAFIVTFAGLEPLLRYRRSLRHAFWISVSLVATLIVVAPFPLTVFYQGLYLLVAVATAIIIAGLIVDPPRLALGVLQHGGLCYVGRISYGLYLWHWVIFRSIDQSRLVHWGLIRYFPALGFTIGLTLGSYYLIEQPALRLKKRFNPAHSAFTALTHELPAQRGAATE